MSVRPLEINGFFSAFEIQFMMLQILAELFLSY